VILIVSLLLTAFGSGSSNAVQTVAVIGKLSVPTRPAPQIIAVRDTLRLQVPIAKWTAIGFHATGDGAVSLSPVGHQGNEGAVLRLVHKIFGGGGSGPKWYQLGGSGPENSAVDVGAPTGTDVYAPVDGTVVGVTPFIVNGKKYGVRIDLQPQTSPSYVVSLTHLRADPKVTVGWRVIAGVSKIGNVVDLSSAERQALARYTQDAGNHVSLEVHPAATLSLN
jgi:murein DD-endopeptidase MepM/ murein hydrolase activator NlpD